MLSEEKIISLDKLAEKYLDGRKNNSRRQFFLGADGILVSTYNNSGTIIIVNVLTEDKFKLVNRFPLKLIRVLDFIVVTVHSKDMSAGLEEIQLFNWGKKTMFSMELTEGQKVQTILCGNVVVYVTTQNEIFVVDLNLEQKPLRILDGVTVLSPVSQLCSMKGEIALIASQFEGIVFNAVTGSLLINLRLPAQCMNTFIAFSMYDNLIIGAMFSSILLWDLVPGNTDIDIAPRAIMTESIPTAIEYVNKIIYVGFAGSMINSYFISGELCKTIVQARINISKSSIKELLGARIKTIVVHNNALCALYESGELVLYWLKKSKKPSQTIFRPRHSNAKYMSIFTDFEHLCVVVDTNKTKDESRSKTMIHLFSTITSKHTIKKKSTEPLEEYQIIPPIPKHEMQRMRTLYACSILDTEPEATFDRITIMTARLLNAPICLVSLSDKDRQWFKSGIGIEAGNQIPRAFSFCSYAILDDAPDVLVVSDTLTDTRFKCNDLVTKPPFVRFYAGAPLILNDGSRIGTLCVIDTKPRGFSLEEKTYLVDLAAIVSDLVDLRRTVLDTKNSNIAASSFSLQSPLHSISNCILSLRDNYGMSKSNPVWNQIQLNLDAAKSLVQNNIELAKGNTSLNSNYIMTSVKHLVYKLKIATQPHQSPIPIIFKIDPDFPREIIVNYNVIFNTLLGIISSISQLSTKEIQVRFLKADKKSIKNYQSVEKNTNELSPKMKSTPEPLTSRKTGKKALFNLDSSESSENQKKANDSLIRVELSALGLHVGEQLKSLLFVQPFVSLNDYGIWGEEWQDDRESSSSSLGVAESVVLLCYTVKTAMSMLVGGDCGAEVGNMEGTLFWIEFLNHMEQSSDDNESVVNSDIDNVPQKKRTKPTGCYDFRIY